VADRFLFRCPGCRRKFKANKDLTGRLKRCGRCGSAFIVRAATQPSAAVAPAPAVTETSKEETPFPVDEVPEAVEECRRSMPGLLRSFGDEATYHSFEPVYRVTLEYPDGSRFRRDAGPSPPASVAEPAAPARTVRDLRFTSAAEALRHLEEGNRAIHKAAHGLILDHGSRGGERRLVVQQLPVWRARWDFGKREGDAWFHGRPLRVRLVDAPMISPRRRVGGAVGLLAVAAAAVALSAAGFFWAPADEPPEAPVRAAQPPPAPRRKLVAADGILRRTDGTLLRGQVEEGEGATWVRGVAIPPWDVLAMHARATDFVEAESRHLADLERATREMESAVEAPPRSKTVRSLLEAHQKRDLWSKLEPLCAAGELPSGRRPTDRIEAVRAALEALLLREPVKVAAPPTEAAPAAPPSSAPEAKALFLKLAGEHEGEARRSTAARMKELAKEPLPHADLLAFSGLLLSRSERDSGLRTDRLSVKTDKVDLKYEGELEKNGKWIIVLRLPAGERVSAVQEERGWTARVPGDLEFESAACAAEASAKTGAKERLEAQFGRLPSERWIAAAGGEHLRAAGQVAEELRKPADARDRGRVLLRYLGGAHASAALRAGSPDEIERARRLLMELGFAETTEGRWIPAEDRTARDLGRLLAEGKMAEAAELVRPTRPDAGFSALYRRMAATLLRPIASREAFDAALEAAAQTARQAATEPEHLHLQALRKAAGEYGICAACGGDAASRCSRCEGRGGRKPACLRCNGFGYTVIVGVDGRSQRCGACKGKRTPGWEKCARCGGDGKLSCAKCASRPRWPLPEHLARLRSCPLCSGEGGTGDLVRFTCPACVGMGVQLVPAADPSAVLR
jgi:hypothetical protein